MQRFQVDERLQGVGKEMTNGKGITPDNYEASLHKNEKKYANHHSAFALKQFLSRPGCYVTISVAPSSCSKNL
jgi:hypothetical protein